MWNGEKLKSLTAYYWFFCDSLFLPGLSVCCLYTSQLVLVMCAIQKLSLFAVHFQSRLFSSRSFARSLIQFFLSFPTVWRIWFFYLFFFFVSSVFRTIVHLFATSVQKYKYLCLLNVRSNAKKCIYIVVLSHYMR